MAGLRAFADSLKSPFFLKYIVNATPLILEECFFFYKGFLKNKGQVQVRVIVRAEPRVPRVPVRQKRIEVFPNTLKKMLQVRHNVMSYALEGSNMLGVTIVFKEEVSFFKDKKAIVTYFHKKLRCKPAMLMTSNGYLEIFFKRPSAWLHIRSGSPEEASIVKQMKRLFCEISPHISTITVELDSGRTVF